MTISLEEHVAREDAAEKIVTELFKDFREWSRRGFGPEDVTWCEVKDRVMRLIDMHTPRAAIATVREREGAASPACPVDVCSNYGPCDQAEATGHCPYRDGEPAPDPAEAMRDDAEGWRLYHIEKAKDGDVWKQRAMQAAELLSLRTEAMRAEIARLLVELADNNQTVLKHCEEDAEAMRATCEAICQRVMQNWRDASSGIGAVGTAYRNQAAGAEQCLNDIAALKGNGEGR